MSAATFNAKQYIKKICKDLAELGNNDKILVTVSGGVDSSTSAALIAKAGLKSELIFIDTGFLRVNESETVQRFFKGNLKILNKKVLFYDALKDISDASEKREIFRQLYFTVLKEYVVKNKCSAIVQGTQFHKTSTKRYHNSPTEDFLALNVKVIEPVKGLSKHQIRLIAKELGLPDEIVNRRPFPGPGLLLRFSGEYTKEKLQTIRNITAIVDTFLEKNKSVFKNAYQVFPYLTSEQAPFVDTKGKGSVGAMVLIRALEVNHIKGETVYRPFLFSPKFQERLTDQIMKSTIISRVCFDMTPKYGSGDNVRHGGTIEYS